MKDSIETRFLLIQGKLRELPVTRRFQGMLLNDLATALTDYQSGDMVGAVNRLSIVAEKIRNRKATIAYAPGLWNSLLASINSLQQSLMRRIEAHIHQFLSAPEKAPSPQGEVDPVRTQGSAGALGLPFTSRLDSSEPIFSVVNSGLGVGIVGSSLSPTTHDGSIGVQGDGRFAGVYGWTSDKDPDEITFGAVGTTEQSLPVPDLSMMAFEGKSGVYGASSDFKGVTGFSENSSGVLGLSQKETGVAGYSENKDGVIGVGSVSGVCGRSAQGIGVRGISTAPSTDNRSIGVYGEGEFAGVYGVNTNKDGYAGVFLGNVEVMGELVASASGFKVPHPLEPEHQSLCHSHVASTERLNIYSGTAVMDDQGKAWVILPAWFESLNRDFRYQLTPIGKTESAPYIEKRIEDHRFLIGGGTPGGEICWEVTGVRRDSFEEDHPLGVEGEKAFDRLLGVEGEKAFAGDGVCRGEKRGSVGLRSFRRREVKRVYRVMRQPSK